MQTKIEIEISKNAMDVKNFNGLVAAQMTITRDLQRNFIGSKSAEETKAYAKSELKKRINFSGDGSAETKEKALDFLTLDVVSKALGHKGLYAEGGENDDDVDYYLSEHTEGHYSGFPRRYDETIYIYNDEEYTAEELIDLADEMAHYDKMDNDQDFEIDNLYTAIWYLGEDEVRIKGDVMMDGGYMAKGGMTKHGLKIGDVIGIALGDSIFVYNKNDEQYYVVNLDKGKRSKANLSDSHKDSYFADGGYMAKGGVHKVNRKYAYFAVNKKTNKIVDGWEIVDDVESLKYYAKMDLKDNDLNPKDYNLLSAKTLKARGIDPYSWDSWAKTGEYAKGGHTQGYDDREDERLAMRHGKISDKDFVGTHEQREHSRRDDARFEERMAKGGEVVNLTTSEKTKLKNIFRYLERLENEFQLLNEGDDEYQYVEEDIDYYYDKYYELKSTLIKKYGKSKGLENAINKVAFDYGMSYKNGGATFQDKVDAISDSLVGTKVKPKYQKENGKTYNKKESIVAAKRIAGAMMKK